MRNLILATWSLVWREVVRFLRQRSRIIGAFGTPIIFWLLIGSGVGHSFRAPNGSVGNYLNYFFAGAMLMIVLFTAIFSTISIIEDRKAGFLQGVIVSPAPILALVLGKVFGGALLAIFQAMLLYLLAPFIGFHLSLSQAVSVLFSILINACTLTALGYILAWPMSSTQGFHAIMNVLLFPMWLLSGALFPIEGAALWIRSIMYINPLTYGLVTLRYALEGDGPHFTWCENIASPVGFSTLHISYLILIFFMLFFMYIAVRQTQSRKHI